MNADLLSRYYKNLIFKNHPDKKGSTEKAALINSAYSRLKDFLEDRARMAEEKLKMRTVKREEEKRKKDEACPAERAPVLQERIDPCVLPESFFDNLVVPEGEELVVETKRKTRQELLQKMRADIERISKK